jgi:hypothetical protein
MTLLDQHASAGAVTLFQSAINETENLKRMIQTLQFSWMAHYLFVDLIMFVNISLLYAQVGQVARPV